MASGERLSHQTIRVRQSWDAAVNFCDDNPRADLNDGIVDAEFRGEPVLIHGVAHGYLQKFNSSSTGTPSGRLATRTRVARVFVFSETSCSNSEAPSAISAAPESPMWPPKRRADDPLTLSSDLKCCLATAEGVDRR